MNIAEKFGRWFVVAVWLLAGTYCLLNAGFDVALERSWHTGGIFDSQDAAYTLAGFAFLAAAILIVRHHRWARPLSLALWAIFGYWDFSSMSTFADQRWFPLTAFALFVLAFLWLLSPAARGDARDPVLHA
jgi:hypothetical protein